MTAEADILRDSRLAAGLAPSDMAGLLGIDEPGLGLLEPGATELDNDLLDR